MNIIKIVRHIKSSIRFIWYHPLVKGRRFRAVFRYIYFHFISRLKKIDKKEFNALWRVMTEESYKWLIAHTKESPSKNIEWWKDEIGYLDIEKL